MVLNWSPARMRWIAATSASPPVIGTVPGLIPADSIAAMAPPAIPSLAEYTPTNPFLPTAVIALLHLALGLVRAPVGGVVLLGDRHAAAVEDHVRALLVV